MQINSPSIRLKVKMHIIKRKFSLCKANLKSTWKLIGTLVNHKIKGQTHPTKIVSNNQTFESKSDIFEQFNRYFVNVDPQLASTIKESNDNPLKYIKNSPVSIFFLSHVTEAQESKLFSELKESKAALGIPNKLIKIAAQPFAKPFAYIFNQYIFTGVVPDVLKLSQVTPVHKNGPTTDPTNCRPIAILSPFTHWT